MGIVLIEVNLFGYDLLPDAIGLVILFFCAVLMTDKAGRFARTAVISAVMIFLEVVRIFSLTEAETVIFVFSLVYMFLKVLLVITAADAVAQFGSLHGNEQVARMCDVTGHVYALTFVFSVMAVWFDSLSMILWLLNILISVFAVIMFIYFYSAIYEVIHDEPSDMPPEASEGEGEEEEETADTSES